MKTKIHKILRVVVPVMCCLVLVVFMALPSRAADLDNYTPSDVAGYTIADYFSSVDVSSSSVVGNLNFNDSYTWVSLHYYEGDSLIQWVSAPAMIADFDHLNITATSDSRLTWMLVPSAYYRSNGAALLPIQGVQNGMQLSIDMTVGSDVPTNASYNSFRIQFIDVDGYSVGQQTGTYSRSKINGLWHYYGNYTFSIPEGAVAWQCFFLYDRTGTEIQTTFDVDIHINTATLTMTNEQFDDIKPEDSDTINGTPDMNDEADQMNDAMNDSADKLGDAMDDLVVEKPDIGDINLNFDDYINLDLKESVYNLIQKIWDLVFIKELLGIVVVLMLLSYILFGKKG